MLRTPLAALLVVFCLGAEGRADDAPPVSTPAPYSLPWLLRSTFAANSVRLDETLAFYKDPKTQNSGTTEVTSLFGSWKLNPRWVVLLRQSWVNNSPPFTPTAVSGNALSNPMIGVCYVRPFGSGWRWNGFFATMLPLGQGGGLTPNPGSAAAVSAATAARSVMENPLYAVNFLGLVVGGDLALVTHDITFQAEANLSQLTRVRGPAGQDTARTNFTSGVHLGHFFSPRASLGGEIHFQRWMSDAAPVKADPTAREQVTFAVGPRLHFHVGPHSWFRPGISYGKAFDDPMAKKGYSLLEFDAPVSF